MLKDYTLFGADEVLSKEEVEDDERMWNETPVTKARNEAYFLIEDFIFGVPLKRDEHKFFPTDIQYIHNLVNGIGSGVSYRLNRKFAAAYPLEAMQLQKIKGLTDFDVVMYWRGVVRSQGVDTGFKPRWVFDMYRDMRNATVPDTTLQIDDKKVKLYATRNNISVRDVRPMFELPVDSDIRKKFEKELDELSEYVSELNKSK